MCGPTWLRTDKVTVIRIVAAVVVDEHGRLLVVRKRGTTTFMQPGGKLEPGETPVEALVREVREELGVDVVDVRELGHHTAVAANEPGHTVDAELFAVELAGEPAAQAEIEEMVWIDPHDPGNIMLAPLTAEAVFDWVRER
ncbi:NUDIX domain-containing protein [Mycobacterium sp. CBMA293]|nr:MULTISPECIES: NUDIX domain-containing protein [unclassified Mycolicibacterium]MUL60361.1 NUDIX domain-containing protein [Mycolicibacterium sp. CBMA 335]MUL71427.1 NUDIX domain-containing protein [Mycolicibacterium sp. CBMA 311]MUL97043.1 NUDIX domain-containing protein [Mycolicibacterium sp. CBMA 230]MUM08470.1 DNA mismatch repair protein MutT [Mycolicibacterium sp. CBMA 213]MUM14879.1 NUDIX domain-containing protein [Mycolicibacterium sp. CBMA 293]